MDVADNDDIVDYNPLAYITKIEIAFRNSNMGEAACLRGYNLFPFVSLLSRAEHDA